MAQRGTAPVAGDCCAPASGRGNRARPLGTTPATAGSTEGTVLLAGGPFLLGSEDRLAYPEHGEGLQPDGEHRMNVWQGAFPAENTSADGYAQGAEGRLVPLPPFLCRRYRIAARQRNTPDSSTGNLGFRCVRSARDEEQRVR